MEEYKAYQFNQKEFTKRLIDFREKNDYSIREVARLIGVSKAGYNKIEFGYVTPSAPTFYNICQLMKLDVHKFFMIPKPITKKKKNETKRIGADHLG